MKKAAAEPDKRTIAYVLVDDDGAVVGSGHCPAHQLPAQARDGARAVKASVLVRRPSDWGHNGKRLVRRGKAGIPAANPWEAVKARRNGLLHDSAWCVLPGSPLTPACQNEVAAYRAALHRVTLAKSPQKVAWPVMPDLAYAEPSHV